MESGPIMETVSTLTDDIEEITNMAEMADISCDLESDQTDIDSISTDDTVDSLPSILTLEDEPATARVYNIVLLCGSAPFG